MVDHTVSSFDDELQGLRSAIMEMGGIAEKMLLDATTALVRRDVNQAQAVVAMDDRLDDLQRQIEERAILTIAKRQPMAVDLREVISAIRIASDIERIGDMAKNIGKRTLAVSGQFEPQKVVLGVNRMSETSMPIPRAISRRRWMSGSATKRRMRSIPRCFANCSPT